jgi:hypothetical protein
MNVILELLLGFCFARILGEGHAFAFNEALNVTEVANLEKSRITRRLTSVTVSDVAGLITAISGNAAEIDLEAGTYLLSSMITIDRSIKIRGPAANQGQAILDGGGRVRVFAITSGAVLLERLHITKGNAQTEVCDDMGNGVLNCHNQCVEGDESSSGEMGGSETHVCKEYGGGVFVNGGSVSIKDSWIYSNTANNDDGRGGGLAVFYGGSVTISDSQIYSNEGTLGSNV